MPIFANEIRPDPPHQTDFSAAAYKLWYIMENGRRGGLISEFIFPQVEELLQIGATSELNLRERLDYAKLQTAYNNFVGDLDHNNI